MTWDRSEAVGYAGIEAGGTKFLCALGTGPGDLHAITRIPTTEPEPTLRETIHRLRPATDPAHLEAVGVASFGPLDLSPGSPTYGHITSTPKPGWRNTDIVGALRAAFDVPIGFDTDVNAAALAEGRWGAAQGLDTFVYLTVGTGIGGGAVVDGRIHHGLMHPEMGHIPVERHPEDAYLGTCPYHDDCIEGLASGPAVAERWGRPTTDLGPHERAATDLEAWYLAQLAATLTYVLSPERVILGGGLADLPGLLGSTRRHVLDRLNGYLEVPVITEHVDRYLVPARLGDRAGVLGAIALAADASGRHP